MTAIDWHLIRLGPSIRVGEILGPYTLGFSLQRLLMVAGANRDFALAHLDGEAAREAGAPGPNADLFFICAMFERTCLAWGGARAVIVKLGPIRISDFTVAGEDVQTRGVVTAVTPGPSYVIDVELEMAQGARVTAHGRATLSIPSE